MHQETLNQTVSLRSFWNEMRTCFALIDRDTSVRVVVISANGKHFSAGLDCALLQIIPVQEQPSEDIVVCLFFPQWPILPRPVSNRQLHLKEILQGVPSI